MQIGAQMGVTPTFTVTESSDTVALTVRHYDITPPITAADSVVVDRMGIRRAWSTLIRGDTIHLSRRYSMGEVIYEYHFLLIDLGANELPRLTMAWTVNIPDYPGTRIDTIRAGVLKVQDWDTSAVMSGRFFGRPSLRDMLNGTVTFWATRKQ